MRERLTTDKTKIFARENITLMSVTKGELRILYNEIFDRLQEYEVAEETGQIIVPPCKVGDKVYDISEFFDGTNCPEIYEYDVSCIHIEQENGKQIFYIADLKYPADDWGKTLFFTKEEAEQALKGGVE